jgi:hypothetical protein
VVDTRLHRTISRAVANGVEGHRAGVRFVIMSGAARLASSRRFGSPKARRLGSTEEFGLLKKLLAFGRMTAHCDPGMGGSAKAGQPGFFNGEDRLKALSAAGDPLERLAQVIEGRASPA